MQQDRKNLIETFLDYNNKINLSAIRNADGVYHKHILDSLELTKALSLESWKTLADIGTGWGFPLLPLAITYPEVYCTGIDARKKKTLAVQAIADNLGLDNIAMIRSRIEEVKDQFDYVTSRAVGYANKIIPRSIPLVRKWGYLILYKQLTPEEDKLIFSLAERYKLSLEHLHHYKLEDDEVQRVIYVFKK